MAVRDRFVGHGGPMYRHVVVAKKMEAMAPALQFVIS